jgi:hypothetical protein
MAKLNLPKMESPVYWKVIKWWALHADPPSDGCSGVKDWYIEACWEHDFHYRYAQTIYREPISFEEANSRFRESIQMRSKLGRFNPISWFRWYGVKTLGSFAWHKHRINNLPFPEMPINPD